MKTSLVGCTVWMVLLLAGCERQDREDTGAIQKDNSPANENPCVKFRQAFSLSILRASGICVCGNREEIAQQLSKDTIGGMYGGCDPEFISLYPLQDSVYLIEIRGPQVAVGTGGYHYYVVRYQNGTFERRNFFQGYVDSVDRGQPPFPEIVFRTFDLINFPEPIRENYTMRLSWDGEKYVFQKLLTMAAYYTEKDCTVVRQKIDPEFNNPKYWEYLSETP